MLMGYPKRWCPSKKRTVVLESSSRSMEPTHDRLHGDPEEVCNLMKEKYTTLIYFHYLKVRKLFDTGLQDPLDSSCCVVMKHYPIIVNCNL